MKVLLSSILLSICFLMGNVSHAQGIPGYPMPMPQQQVLQAPAMPPLVPPVSEAWVNGWQEVYIHRYEPLRNTNTMPPAQYYVPTQQPCVQQPNPYYPQCQQYYYVPPCQTQRNCWGW